MRRQIQSVIADSRVEVEGDHPMLQKQDNLSGGMFGSAEALGDSGILKNLLNNAKNATDSAASLGIGASASQRSGAEMSNNNS